MENTKNEIFKRFLQNISLAFKTLTSDTQIDNDVELMGELARDPISSLNNFQNSQTTKEQSSPSKTKTQSKSKTPKTKTRANLNKNDNELDR